jgi:cytochrome P450
MLYGINTDLKTTLVRAYRDYGPISFLDIAGTRLVLMLGPRANEVVFGDPGLFSWAGGYELLAPVVGPESILVSDGRDHKRRRGVAQRALTAAAMDDYLEKLRGNVDRVMNRWRPGSVVDLRLAFKSAIRHSILQLIIGDLTISEVETLGDDLQTSLDILNANLAVQGVIQRVPNPKRFAARRRLARFDRALVLAIAKRRENGYRGDILGALVAHGDALTAAELRDIAVGLIVAGYDTTASAMGWLAYSTLAIDGVREKVREELRLARTHSAEQLTGRQLPYSSMLINETLRLYPAAAAGSRKVASGFTFDGHEVRTGSYVLFSQYVTHTDPDVWTDPHTLRAERWNHDAGHRRPTRFEYLPFGTGARRCIGASLATNALSVILTQLISRAKLTLCQRGEPRAGGTIATYPRYPVLAHVDAVV